MVKRTAFALGVAASLLSAQTMAATDQADLAVGMKTLPLLTNKITGSATVAVVFDPANAASKSEADAIKAIIEGGLQVSGDVKLSASLVSVGDLGKLSGAKMGWPAIMTLFPVRQLGQER